jgi:calcineurin-like phosphoesterase family protein
MKEGEYITSDHHFGHGNIIDYSNRPFPVRPDYVKDIEKRVKGYKDRKHKLNTDEEEDMKVWKRWLRENVHLMNEELIQRWNAKVPQGSIVYHLGDFGFMDPDRLISLVKRLNGTIRLVRGNHDKKALKSAKVRECFDWVREYYESKTDNGIKVVMSHYPFLTWNGSHRGSWMLHGHCHSNLRDDGVLRRLDIGVDAHPNYEPFSYYEIRNLMKNRGHEPVDHHLTYLFPLA